MNTDKSFFGHPIGLRTLFLTEMWERMSFYGMRGLLVLFMTREVVDGGLNLDPVTAMAIYGVYGASVYFLCVPGGWVADKIFGAQKTVLYGAVIITLGHYVLAIPFEKTFFFSVVSNCSNKSLLPHKYLFSSIEVRIVKSSKPS